MTVNDEAGHRAIASAIVERCACYDVVSFTVRRLEQLSCMFQLACARFLSLSRATSDSARVERKTSGSTVKLEEESATKAWS